MLKSLSCVSQNDAERGNEYILYVLMTPNFCEALFNDGSLPDLRGAFRY